MLGLYVAMFKYTGPAEDRCSLSCFGRKENTNVRMSGRVSWHMHIHAKLCGWACLLIAWFVIPNHNIYSLVNICLYGIKKRLSLKCEHRKKFKKKNDKRKGIQSTITRKIQVRHILTVCNNNKDGMWKNNKNVMQGFSHVKAIYT